MQGYRTLIVAALQLVTGILTMTGITISDEMQAQLADSLDAIVGGVLIITGIVTALMRAKTTTPVGKKD